MPNFDRRSSSQYMARSALEELLLFHDIDEETPGEETRNCLFAVSERDRVLPARTYLCDFCFCTGDTST